MSDFPRTTVGGVSLPRLICGTNGFLGYSHTSAARAHLMRDLFDTPGKIAQVMAVFAQAGCDAIMGPLHDFLIAAREEAQQLAGREITFICTPGHASSGKLDEWEPLVARAKEIGATFCFPHQCMTDPRLDSLNRRLMPELDQALRVVRQYGMIPGLSTHTPQSIICADESGADVESYVQPYNSAGLYCHVELDWIQRTIVNAKKPVMTIKPLAAGRILPPPGLAFAWSTIRDCDMVTIGTICTYEAEEAIEISRACLEKRQAEVELQVTRSKESLLPR